jgi:CRISPR/Cas system-associated protein Cas5 (RAMP superfamily)
MKFQKNELMKMAGMGDCSEDDFRTFMIELKGTVRNSKFMPHNMKQKIFDEIDSIVKEAEFSNVSRDDRLKLAHIYDSVARISKVSHYFPVEDKLFNITDLVQDETLNELIYNKKHDKYYHSNAISKITPEIFKSYFGEKLAERVYYGTRYNPVMRFKELKKIVENEMNNVDLEKFEEMVRFANL